MNVTHLAIATALFLSVSPAAQAGDSTPPWVPYQPPTTSPTVTLPPMTFGGVLPTVEPVSIVIPEPDAAVPVEAEAEAESVKSR